MSFQFENFNLERLIIHEIFKRNLDKSMVEPKVGVSLIELDGEGREKFAKRLTDAMGNNSHSIEMSIDKNEEGSIFQLISRSISSHDNGFIDISKSITRKLADAQATLNIPGGVIVVFTGTVGSDGKKCFGIIKADVHEGFRKIIGENGSLMMEYVGDLLLTPQQKLFKIGVFILKDERGDTSDSNNYFALVFDHQMAPRETRSAAFYFYDTFLGCTYSPSDKKLTEDFYNNTKEFINTASISDEEKFDLTNSLVSYLKTDRASTIRIKDYADRYMDNSLAGKYVAHMKSKSFPTRAVGKDTAYIHTKLRMRKMTFSSKIRISGPPSIFEKSVKILGPQNGSTIVSISGKLESQE